MSAESLNIVLGVALLWVLGAFIGICAVVAAGSSTDEEKKKSDVQAYIVTLLLGPLTILLAGMTEPDDEGDHDG